MSTVDERALLSPNAALASTVAQSAAATPLRGASGRVEFFKGRGNPKASLKEWERRWERTRQRRDRLSALAAAERPTFSSSASSKEASCWGVDASPSAAR